MKHLDQHTLELFLLGSTDLELSHRQIERHLRECQGCRDLHEEISQYYVRVGENFERAERGSVSQDEALVVRARDQEVVARGVQTLPFRPPFRGVARTFSFVWQHPVATGVSSLILASAVFGAITLTTRLTKDSNPSYAHLNPGQNKIEIFNREGEKIWDIPAKGTAEAAVAEGRDGVEAVKVVDLDGNGKNEVITTVRGVGGDARDVMSLCIFASDGRLKKRNTFDRAVRFRGREYTDGHIGVGVVVGDFGGDGRKQILCRAFTGWSPSVVLRYDSNGELLGEYWHYGHITQLSYVLAQKDSKQEILIAGSNDVSDSVAGSEFAVVGLLSPDKIAGQTEATTTPGFGYSPSTAELGFVRLPNTPLNLAFRSKPGISGMNVNATDVKGFANIWWLTKIANDEFVLEYILGRDLSVQTIRPADGAVRLLARLENEKKITANDARKMTPEAWAGVRYWDGLEWLARPTELSLNKPPE